MIELIAQGDKPEEQWRRALAADQVVVLGRDEDTWAVPWDPWISRRHAELTWHNGRLKVQQLPTARNPIFCRGKEVTVVELKPHESFIIGRTLFTLREEGDVPSPDARPLLQVRAVGSHELERIPFRDAPHRIDVLTRLPDVISSAVDDAELFVHLGNLLLAGIHRADAVALVATEARAEGEAAVRVLHADSRRGDAGAFRPSQRLVREAVDHLQRTVLHVWRADQEPAAQTFTLGGNFDWAYCTPVRGEASKGWGIYVAGRFVGEGTATILAPWESNDLGDDLKFTELVAAIVSSLRRVQKLERDQGVLSRFFSPTVRRVLTAAESEQALKPRLTEVTVLFCDLRGFSHKVEATASDLPGVLDRVSQALGVMTQHILQHQGVIADLLGDAALGFWGWPIAQPNMVQQVCEAALGIRTSFAAFAQRPDHPLAEFQMGIGVATGPAVAGGIGTRDQVKVTVFGPVVNLASRLEGMTKILHVPILLDEATAQVVGTQMPRDVARCRRLARVRPYGLEQSLMVSELLPPWSPGMLLTDEHLACYEAALDAFLKGEWATAYELLHRIPPQDLGKDYLTGFIIQNNHVPPPGWDGVIPMTSKR